MTGQLLGRAPYTIAFYLFFQVVFVFPVLLVESEAKGKISTCRTYCGNLTVDYPLGLSTGCGHPGFRDLLFCVNDVLMFHISSGSYRVLDIDYAYGALTLHDPGMATCDSLRRRGTGGGKGNGFVLESWRASYLVPAPDNLFMLIGCGAESPLFQGFPNKHLPCRNLSGIGCDDYYACPAWEEEKEDKQDANGGGPPRCCGVAYGDIKAINLSRLECKGYSSAYSAAPLRVKGAAEWTYGIRLSYSVPGEQRDFCRVCEATGGNCGYDDVAYHDLCLCPHDWNSTSTCDTGADSRAAFSGRSSFLLEILTGLVLVSLWGMS